MDKLTKLLIGWFIFVLILAGIGVYVAFHFIHKFW